jgi:hypothetical protein
MFWIESLKRMLMEMKAGSVDFWITSLRSVFQSRLYSGSKYLFARKLDYLTAFGFPKMFKI